MAVWGGNGVGDDNGIFGQRFAVVNTFPTVEIGSNATVDEGAPGAVPPRSPIRTPTIGLPRWTMETAAECSPSC